MEISKDIQYIGVNDRQVDLFEGQYRVPNGMAYNSYVVTDDKIAVFDTVDVHFTREWLENLERVLNGRKPDYLIVQHMEPDHSANILNFMEKYKEAKIVSSSKSFQMMKNFFGVAFEERGIVVGEKDTLCLGKRNLSFIAAPMVHWPEVIVTYDDYDKTLFSADAFGKFGALDAEEPWADEARRYYIGIVGKYGAQVQALLKKVSGLEISRICSLHGPVLDGDLSYYLKLYHTWSSYSVEEEGTVVAYASIYGNTRRAAELLAKSLKEKGENVVVYDLARCDLSEAVAAAFRYGKLALASSTYNGDIFPPMKAFLQRLTERNYQNRTVGLIENGTWAPAAAKGMKAMLEASKQITFADTSVRILSALNAESASQIEKLAEELHGAS